MAELHDEPVDRIDHPGKCQRPQDQCCALARAAELHGEKEDPGVAQEPEDGLARGELHEGPQDDDGEGDQGGAVAAPFELMEPLVEERAHGKDHELNADQGAEQAPGPGPVAGKRKGGQADGDEESPEQDICHKRTG